MINPRTKAKQLRWVDKQHYIGATLFKTTSLVQSSFGAGVKFLSLIALCFSLTFANCGGSSDNNPTGDDDDDNNDDSEEPILTEKLEGTPFEGMIIGDDFSETTFICNDYATRTIDSFPIQIFAAFFTASEEEIVQEGIDIANEGISFDAYELTNEWGNDLRVIYKVDTLEGALGQASSFKKDMEHEGGALATPIIAVDWQILLRSDSISKWLVAHELGHATGIRRHELIDYDNDRWVDLEENSLMSASYAGEPALDDYNYMMQMQGQLMQDYLREEGTRLGTDPCI